MLLSGKPVKQSLKHEVRSYVQANGLAWRRVSFFLLDDNEPSRVYVGLKCKFAESVWLVGEQVDGIGRDKQRVLDEIASRNSDPDCVGIVIQLPLPELLQDAYHEIVGAVSPAKDLDGLGGVLFGLSQIGAIDFLPATPRAVLALLDHYELWDVHGKHVAVIGQSNLVGKPLAVELMKRGATVLSCNAWSGAEAVKKLCAECEIIISATGVVDLIGEWFFPADIDLSDKVLVDVWRWLRDGKAVGDIATDVYMDQVRAITPVPGGVWPVTVACLFANLMMVDQQREMLQTYVSWRNS